MGGKGFTLVELLVTIVILSILITIALVSYGKVQKGARDTKRMSDISSIQAALEQYHADQGVYPTGIFGSRNLTYSTKTYMLNIPLETKPGWSPYVYQALATSLSSCTNVRFPTPNPSTFCTNYCLQATVENSSNAVRVPKCSAPPTGASQYQTQAP